MSRFFCAHKITKPEDVIPYLAKQGRHWKQGYSAYELAHSWVNADDIPAPVRSALDTCPDYAGALSRVCSSATWTCEHQGAEARPTCSPSPDASTETP